MRAQVLLLSLAVLLAIPGIPSASANHMLQVTEGPGYAYVEAGGPNSWTGHEHEFLAVRVTVNASRNTNVSATTREGAPIPEGAYRFDVDARRLTVSPGRHVPEGWNVAFVVRIVHEGASPTEALILGGRLNLQLVARGATGENATAPSNGTGSMVNLSLTGYPSVLRSTFPPPWSACESFYRTLTPANVSGEVPFTRADSLAYDHGAWDQHVAEIQFTGRPGDAEEADALCPSATVRFENLGTWPRAPVAEPGRSAPLGAAPPVVALAVAAAAAGLKGRAAGATSPHERRGP